MTNPIPPSEAIGEPFPSQARVVVIGGGIVGASVLFHLTERGWKDVVLLERKTLTSGTTWHAAGLVGQLRATYNMSLLASYAKDLFRELERRTGSGTGFEQHGSLLIASTPGRWEEIRRSASMAPPPRRRPGARGPGAGRRDVAAPRHQRHPRRRVHPGRRDGEPDRRDPGAGPGGPAWAARGSSSTRR